MRPVPIDKPLRREPRCARCGRARNQHQAMTLRCPKGKRGPSGYKAYAETTFAPKR